jgi:hypothetical protein
LKLNLVPRHGPNPQKQTVCSCFVPFANG